MPVLVAIQSTGAGVSVQAMYQRVKRYYAQLKVKEDARENSVIDLSAGQLVKTTKSSPEPTSVHVPTSLRKSPPESSAQASVTVTPWTNTSNKGKAYVNNSGGGDYSSLITWVDELQHVVDETAGYDRLF